ncbi:thyrotropin-releasing hormone-degrading ectoenzyme-like [Bacillus rossius redtenbacheri]|uniref:thyrotropin-releasing hormone-degrading ectoenzyme-like n=1 Tax=Bacillus rossius redtenbacheri TaxID=93214 RepID=UPI002FDD10EC
MRAQWWPGATLLLLTTRCVLGELRLPGTVVPRWYRLELLPRAAEGTFAGRLRVNVTCRADTDTVVLHADPALRVTADDITVCHPSTRASWSEPVSVVDVQRNSERQLIILLLSRRLNRHSSYSIHLQFEGRMGGEGEHGLIRTKYFDRETNNTEWYVVTSLRPEDARKVFPCFDEAEYKATFEVSVGTPSHQHVFSNTPLADIENVDGLPGWYWKHFPVTPLMSTYSAGIVVLEFEHFSQPEGSFHIVGPTSIESSIENTIKYLQDVYEYLQDYFDFPYPLQKLDIVFVPGVYRGSASWGLVVLGEDCVTSADRRGLASKMAAQWVGHLATPRGRNDWPACAGLALFLGHQFRTEFKYADELDETSFNYGYGQEIFQQVRQSEAEKMRNKVFWLLHMLQHSLTEKTLRTGLHELLVARQFQVFSTKVLWSSLTQQARRDATLPQDVTVEDVSSSWLGKDLFPVLNVVRDYARGTVTVTQHVLGCKESRCASDGGDSLWYIPVSFLAPGDSDVSTAGARHWLRRQREMTVDEQLRPEQFLVADPSGTGMFMVNYDPTNWALLAEALHRKVLPVAVRTKLLRDSWNLAFAGELNFNTAMNMTLFLEDETEHDVWDVMFSMFHHIDRLLDGSRAGDKLKWYVSGLAARPGTRSGLLNCMGHGGPEETQPDDWARRGKVPSGLQADTMCNILITSDLAEFQRALMKIFMQLRSSGSKFHESVVSCFPVVLTTKKKLPVMKGNQTCGGTLCDQ